MRRVVRLRGVTVLLGRFPALAACDFDAYESEVVFLQGANGSGKTTLLRLCCGLQSFSKGRVELFGRDMMKDRDLFRGTVAYVGHAPSLYEDLTVEENLRFAACASRTDWKKMVDVTLQLEVPAKVMTTQYSKLSAGQRKRVALCSALAREPELLLLDEPHASLDSVGKTLIDLAILEISKRGGTVIVASHEVERAEPIATRRYLLSGGQAREMLEEKMDDPSGEAVL